MDEEGRSLPYWHAMACWSAITASVSHELKNVIAVIGELTGLQEDLLAAAEQGHGLDTAKLGTISGKTQKQLARAEAIVQRLNRFAHTVDEPDESTDVAQTMELVASLCQRLADLGEVRLETRAHGEPLRTQGSAFVLLQAIYAAIRTTLQGAPRGATITVSCEPDGDGIMLVVEANHAFEEHEECEPHRSVLALLARELGGKAEEHLAAGETRFVLRIPRAV